MRAWLSLSRDQLLAMRPRDVAAQLAHAQAQRLASIELPQLDAWEAAARMLQGALAAALADDARILFEFDILRLDKRLDAVIVTSRAVFVLEFKHGARRFELADQRQVDDYAQDLFDFHAASRAHPIIPILVATAAPAISQPLPLLLHGATPVLCCNAAGLAPLLDALWQALPPGGIDVCQWEQAPYRPVPSIITAASLLYARHGIAEIGTARADATNLTRTSEVVRSIIARSREQSARSVIFVTGIPGAGKTLCGLNIAFADDVRAAFLSGNVPLVRVLREALARNAAEQAGTRLEAERHKTHGVLQNVHRFLEEGVTSGHAPAENVIVFDEAQRAWNAAQATRSTQRRKSHLTASEPAHALEIMTRAPGFAVIVALVGQGQEINTGEAGLAEWGRAIEASGIWLGHASPVVLHAERPEQRLPAAPWLRLDDALHLAVPVRAIRSDVGAAWVEAVLAAERDRAAGIAGANHDLPFYLTRDLPLMRRALRDFCRGQRRAGLVAAAGARRLRAEGLGVQVPEIEDWFLRRWPDVRSSEALETFATEYDCQGLELDAVGLAWGGDMLWTGVAWQMRDFTGTRWNQVRNPMTREFIRNSYRVLLTRARYETVIWVPRGSPGNAPDHDATRDATQMDAIADYLLACGVQPLPAATPMPLPELLL